MSASSMRPMPSVMSGSSDEATILEVGVPDEEHVHGSHGGPLYPRRALKMGGLNFSPVYNEWDNLHRMHKRGWAFTTMSVGLQGLTGVLTGIAAALVGHVSQKLGRLRLDVVLSLLDQHSWLQAWLGSLGIMTVLALAAALPVILCVPLAGSSGIPSIMGLLNGCDLRAHFSLSTLVVRLVGVTFAVASGVAVGPEGPMIFIGASIGELMSRFPSSEKVWRHLGRPPSSLNRHVYLRDYISTGAACGIAAAFRAPIAGTLFVIEEAASHFKREHLLKIFFGSLAAMIVATSSCGLLGDKGLFEYKVATGDACLARNWFTAPSIVFFAAVGVVCGFAGALFNWVNIRAATWRAAVGGRVLVRTLDVLLLCAATSACWVGLPLLFGELPAGRPEIFARGTSCIKDTWLPQLIRDARTEGHGDGHARTLRYHPEPCLYGVQFNPFLCPVAHNLSKTLKPGSEFARACAQRLIQGSHIAKMSKAKFYCCNFTSPEGLLAGKFQLPANASCPIDLGPSFPSFPSFSSLSKPSQANGHLQGSADPGRHYNPMAALTLVPLDQAAQNLFSRGAPYVLPLQALLVFCPVFFLLAALTAGSAIPSGLLLPMIVIGAVIGRVLSILLMDLQASLGWYRSRSAQDSLWSAEWQPFFPDAGGPLPDGVPLATIGWIDPGIGAFAGAAAFLGGSSRISLTITVMMVEITGDPVMIAPAGVATLVAVILGNRLNHGLYHQLIDVASFPYLPDRWPKDIPKSLRVEHVLSQESVVCISLAAQREDVEQLLRMYDYTGFPVLSSDGVVVGIVSRSHLQCLLAELTDTVDVGRVTDFHFVTIRASLPLEVAFTLFKRMEISHIIVVDDNHRPVAVLTRSSLLPWHVKEHIGPRLEERVRQTIQRPRGLRSRDNLGEALDLSAPLGSEALPPEQEGATEIHVSMRE